MPRQPRDAKLPKRRLHQRKPVTFAAPNAAPRKNSHISCFLHYNLPHKTAFVLHISKHPFPAIFHKDRKS